MEELVKGDVAVLPFPFSDLSAVKKRPALVAATLKGDDIILCQITSAERKDYLAIPLANSDFQEGSLNLNSNIRPNKLFTADKSLILYKAGSLKKRKIQEVEAAIIRIFSQ